MEEVAALVDIPWGAALDPMRSEHILRLQSRVDDRPKDRRALMDLFTGLYSAKQFVSASDILKRAIDCGEHSGRIFELLGKCLFRKWTCEKNREGKIRFNL